MSDHPPTVWKLRARILGALLRDARLAAHKELSECAAACGIPPEQYEAYELGKQAPSLPELEALAYFLQVPLEHFWERTTFEETAEDRKIPNLPQLLKLRQRMIGALLRQARLEAGASLEAVAEKMELNPTELEEYELGQKAIPVPQLETLIGLLSRSIREFQDRHGPVGAWLTQQQALQDFQQLPLELQVFVSKPVNRPYLELAQRLSEMDIDRLRALAEGLLEITY